MIDAEPGTGGRARTRDHRNAHVRGPVRAAESRGAGPVTNRANIRHADRNRAPGAELRKVRDRPEFA